MLILRYNSNSYNKKLWKNLHNLIFSSDYYFLLNEDKDAGEKQHTKKNTMIENKNEVKLKCLICWKSEIKILFILFG